MTRLTRWFVLLILAGNITRGAEAPRAASSLTPEVIRNSLDRLNNLEGLPLIHLLQQLAKAANPTAEDLFTFSLGFGTACRQAEPSQYPLLVEIFTALPVDSRIREEAYSSFANLALRRELEQLSPESIKVSIPPEQPLPDRLSDHLGPERAAALRQFLAAKAPFAALKMAAAAQKKRPSFYIDRATYWKKTDDLILNGTPVKAEEFLAFQEVYSCMPIEPLMGVPKVIVTIALIREHRFTEAVGAALDMRELVEGAPSLKKQLLSLCGLDPAPLLTGALAAREYEFALTPQPAPAPSP